MSSHFGSGDFRLAISGWQFWVGPFQVWYHFGFWPFQVSSGLFRLGHFGLEHFRLITFYVWGCHFRLGHFRLNPFQVSSGHFRLGRMGPLRVGAISHWGHFGLGPFRVGTILGCAISGWAILGCPFQVLYMLKLVILIANTPYFNTIFFFCLWISMY